MTKRAGAALLVAMAALFLAANRAAYKGYFQDDELNNIAWTRNLPVGDYAKAILTPRLFSNNFRPVGHFYFREMSLLYGLDFPKYLPVLHIAHLLNVWLVWTIARQLGIGPLPASLGTLFFAFHMAAFDVYWKPMYVFDLFCATFSLLAILCYLRRRYIPAFIAFWLAYKSKELAVMVPLVLACYELWLAKDRNWKRLAPFFAVSLLFGLQALAANPHADTSYAFRFAASAFWTSLRFYASQIFLIPFAGMTLIVLPAIIRDRRLWFGCAILFLFLLPLLFLPGRLFAAYCYLPLTGVALAVASAASQPNLTPVVALLCALWIPWNILHLRRNRNATLSLDSDYRHYVSTLADFAKQSRGARLFVYDGLPDGFHAWGLAGALQFLYGEPGLAMRSFSSEDNGAALEQAGAIALQWNSQEHRLGIASKKAPSSYLRTSAGTDLWQLGTGWYSQESGFRWASPHAIATLASADGARDFELVAEVPSSQMERTGAITVTVKLNGESIGERQITSAGLQTLRWKAPRSNAAQWAVEIDVAPALVPANGDTRRLGIPVVGFGFR